MTASDRRGVPVERFETVRAALRAYLRRHYRLLSNEHDDLLQQALSDLFAATRARTEPLADGELQALAYAILKRRIADRFRRQARSVLQQVDEAAVPEPHDDGSFDKRMHHRRLLRAVLLLVDELDPAQQALVLDEALPASGDRPRTPAERQQLRRLRERLKARLAGEFGLVVDNDAME